MFALDVITHSPAQTYQLGQQLGAMIREGDLICLCGELGAGKTTLASGIGNGWGAREIVNSPTFVFVNEYSDSRGRRLYHIDAYRLRDAADSQSIALDDLLNDPHGAVMIEWAERVQDVLPNEYLQIDLVAVDDQTRQVKLEARGEQYKKIVESLVLRDT
ncbi:MAG: tRNA (adenosine(37)-N6)-threonylcarbamoyltransferase complex ATPase subunit type 1 TsaE [Chloroflexi bacterium]|nr:tRNA (adenosine(37)-N6)-threonylcarbamoyltransferase complex ATPase subunit type 1 TsaE [Chloroflexota bacterium]